jgi:hypothetical protein
MEPQLGETEIFKMYPFAGRCYEYAEYTRTEGNFPNVQYFTNIPPRHLGRFERYEGPVYVFSVDRITPHPIRGCFREVPCPPPYLESIKQKVTPIPSLRTLALQQLPSQSLDQYNDFNRGGRNKKSNKTKTSKKTNKKRKYGKSKKSKKSRKSSK